MSGWGLATWAAIVVLIGGSIAVLAWFLVDVRRWLRGETLVAPDDRP